MTLLTDSDSVVLLEVSERIATITLNRPAARNALSSEVLKMMPRLMKQADASDDVDVIILTGTDPAFCAGLDLKELGSSGKNLGSGSGADGRPNADGVRGPFPGLTKPLIGAVNGVAITGGFELALNCDFLVASEHAKFGDTHARVGVMPGWGLTVLLPQAIGVRRAREMSMTGNFMLADEALERGLVNHVVPHGDLMAFTLPPLPYSYDALEPHIDEATMKLHHGKHHQAYVDKLNAAIAAVKPGAGPLGCAA